VDWQNPEQLRFVLREGKKRQIRRMCEQVGLHVVGLKRIRIGACSWGCRWGSGAIWGRTRRSEGRWPVAAPTRRFTSWPPVPFPACRCAFAWPRCAR
jgi:hypothetical protein